MNVPGTCYAATASGLLIVTACGAPAGLVTTHLHRVTCEACLRRLAPAVLSSARP